ncbi:MAG: BatA domain-containing protein [Kiritimatiellia bacterium]
MAFLNSIWLWMGLGLFGVAVPVAIHLLNRFYGRRTEWAAMELLRRALVTRANQVRLEDLLMLLLRCLVISLLAFALARPTLRSEAGKWVGGQRRVGVVIAIDASYSMAHGEFSSRFKRAVARAREILETVEVGDPVTIVLMGSQPRILQSSVGYVPAQSATLLETKAVVLSERLNLESSLERIEELTRDLKAPMKECYLITDAQALTWETLSDKSKSSLRQIAALANLFLAQVQPEGEENLALVGLDFASGTLRKDGAARFSAEVRNQGTKARKGATVTFSVNGEPVGRQPLESIAPGQTKAVSFVTSFDAPGYARLSAELSADELAIDNTRHAVVRIPATVRVLCVDGDRKRTPFESETDYVAAALRLKKTGQKESVLVTTLAPQDLASETLRDYDVILMANVDHVTPDQVARLFAFVKEGGGLIFSLGGNVEPDLYNSLFRANGESLLPGEITVLAESPAEGTAGWSIAPPRSRHPLSAFLDFLPRDLLDAGGFRKAFRVKAGPGAQEILRFNENDLPLLLEKRLGRGSVLLFTSTMDREWTDFPVQPLCPILVQQMVSYLIRAGAMKQYMVGEPVFLPAGERTPGSTITLRGPNGKDTTVKVVERDGQTAAAADSSEGTGFYVLRGEDGREVSPPVVVNVDPTESDVKITGQAALATQLSGVPMRFLSPGVDLPAFVRESRVGRELGGVLLILALVAFITQSVLAKRFTKRIKGRRGDMSKTVQERDVIAARKV